MAISTRHPTHTTSTWIADRTLNRLICTEKETENRYQIIMILFDEVTDIRCAKCMSKYQYVLKRLKEPIHYIVLKFHCLKEKFDLGSSEHYIYVLPKQVITTTCITIAFLSAYNTTYKAEFDINDFKNKHFSLVRSSCKPMLIEQFSNFFISNPSTMPSPHIIFNHYLLNKLSAEKVHNYLKLFFQKKLSNKDKRDIKELNQLILKDYFQAQQSMSLESEKNERVESGKKIPADLAIKLRSIPYTEKEWELTFRSDSFTSLEEKGSTFNDPLLLSPEEESNESKSLDDWSFLETSPHDGLEVFDLT